MVKRLFSNSYIVFIVSVAEKIKQKVAEIREYCRAISRDPAEIKIVGITKNQPFQKIIYSYHAGLLDIGESYAQELVKKAKLIEEIPELKEKIRFHFIGRLQRNKLKLLAGIKNLRMIQSLARKEEVDSICKYKDLREIDYLIQLKSTEEKNRNGCTFEEARELLEHCLAKKLNVMGIMIINFPGECSRDTFRSARELRDNLEKDFSVELPVLSMGMSRDWRDALIEGSTMLRLGEFIYGKREHSKLRPGEDLNLRPTD